ncbi:MAG: hypothetical protein ABI306_06360 [Caulobacteraceae bacterium]
MTERNSGQKEKGAGTTSATAEAEREERIVRRRRLIDEIFAKAPRMKAGAIDSVDLIREDRDSR